MYWRQVGEKTKLQDTAEVLGGNDCNGTEGCTFHPHSKRLIWITFSKRAIADFQSYIYVAETLLLCLCLNYYSVGFSSF